jgi:hypothetical protein
MGPPVIYAVRHWPKRRYAAHASIQHRLPQRSYHLQLAFRIYPVGRCYITRKSSLKKQIRIKTNSLLFPISFTNTYLVTCDLTDCNLWKWSRNVEELISEYTVLYKVLNVNAFAVVLIRTGKWLSGILQICCSKNYQYGFFFHPWFYLMSLVAR